MNMKRFFLMLVMTITSFQLYAQQAEVLVLPPVDKSVNTSVFDALQNRKSERAFSDRYIDKSVLSQLLWAACGVNRPDGKITAPSAMNAQDVLVYVCLSDAAWRYDAGRHALVKVCDGDLRGAVAGRQDFVKTAPVCLVLVSDVSKLGGSELMGAMDAGIVAENVALACSALKLATVPRVSMDNDALRKALKLEEQQVPMMNLPVGYPQ